MAGCLLPSVVFFDGPGSVEADTVFPDGAGSVSLSGLGCGDLTLFRDDHSGLRTFAAFPCCHRATSCSQQLYHFVWFGLRANSQHQLKEHKQIHQHKKTFFVCN